jgi:predicted alpha/beta-fold hydrolase
LAGGALNAPESAAGAAEAAASGIELDRRFLPPALLRNPHLQSILPGLPLLRAYARSRAAALLAGANELILDCGAGVRLQAFHTPAPAPGATRKLAVLLHGWEGSAESSNVLSLAAALHARGYALARLNLRDHGDTHHLNAEIFHSCRLAEVVGAIGALAAEFPDTRLYLAGFSLGGNFMLRAAADRNLPAVVAAAVAVSPVLDPARTLAALEHGLPLYRRHFVHRWSQSLRAKAQAWPRRHQFGDILRSADLRLMTAELVRRCTDFADLSAYLEGYAITGPRLAHPRVPARLLLAQDDPLIPKDDLPRLAASHRLRVTCTRFGGHCGFLERFSAPTFADRFVIEQFAHFD